MNRTLPSMVVGHTPRGGSPVADWTRWMDAVYGPFMRGVGDLWTRALDPSVWTRRDRGERCSQDVRRERCGKCGQERDLRCDPCACEICDADLAVFAYPGEVRLLPITVENTRSHERTISPEVSRWSSSRGDQADWPTQVTPERIVLAPCSEQMLVVRVQVGGQKTPSGVDLAGCHVFYADLRLAGCDLRSIRLAVAVLSEACGAYLARCGCCCGG